MSTALQGRIAIRARQVKPGEAYAVEVKAGQVIQITDVSGKQVADFVAFNADNRAEHLSVATTRTVGNSIMLQQGMQLVSNRRTPMFELIEDTVGRHDMLLALCDRPAPEPETPPATPPDPEPVPAEETAGESTDTDEPAAEASPSDTESNSDADAETPPATETAADDPGEATEESAAEPEPVVAELAGCLTAISQALDTYDIPTDQIPDPINWFMNVGIKGRGELEIREPLSERNDYVVLSVLMDSIIAVTACSQSDDATNGEQPTDILVRVYR